MMSFRRIKFAAVLAALVILLVPLASSAHERRDVGDGAYTLVVGFLSEPAFVGGQNGLSLSVTKPDGEESIPVEDLQTTLSAEVIYADQKMDLPLTPGYGQPGKYQSIFFPMAAGDYSFHIFGEIEGVAIDEMFTSSPNGFDAVQERTPLEFPKDTGLSSESVTGLVFPSTTTQAQDSGTLVVGLGIGLLLGFGTMWFVARRRFDHA